MRSKVLAVTVVLCLSAAPVFAQTVNSKNPGIFQKYAAPVSGRLAFFASDQGKQTLLNAPSPLARALLVRYFGAQAGAQWDSIKHDSNGPGSENARKGRTQRNHRARSRFVASAVATRCSPTRFNLESYVNALPQNEESIDFKYQGGSSTAADMAGEAANDFRGFVLPEGSWSPSLSGYYVIDTAGCTPRYEGALPPVQNPLYSGDRMFGVGDPIINFDSNHDSWFYSSIYTSEAGGGDGVGVFRNTTTNLKSANCPSGTHNLTTAVSCWPVGPAASGFNAIIVDQQTSANFFADKPDSWVDTRASGTGAGNVYITDTLFTPAGSSYIHLTACTNDLTSCSSPEIISGGDAGTQFSDVKTTASGNITVTYGNYNVTKSPNGAYFYSADIKYVVCTPNGAPSAPTCNAPLLVTTEYQPISLLADLTDVRNNTYPTHVEAGIYSYVFWERCHNFSGLPFGTNDSLTCPQADIVGAESGTGGTSWVPFAIDTGTGHKIMPWASYDASLNNIVIAYSTCNNNQKNACETAYRTITGGSTAVSASTIASSYSWPEAEANRPFFQPLDGDYIGLSAHNGHSWFGYTDTLRFGSYGSPAVSNTESNNNVVSFDGL